MKSNKKGSFKIGIVGTTLILAGITLAFILLVTNSQKSKMTNQTVPSPAAQSTVVIKNTSDLDAAAKQLDNIDPNTLDQHLNAVTIDNSAI